MIKKFFFYFITISFILLLSLAMTEFFLSFKQKKSLEKYSNLKNFMSSPREYHPEYGWNLKKNYEFYYLTEDNHVVRRVTNNMGFASNYDNNIYSKKYKILIVGDSFTEGLGVDTEKSWPNQLQDIIKNNLTKNIEIYNAAVAGYNLDQYYFRIRELDELIKPDLILLGFSSATDFYDVGKNKRYFVYGKKIGRNYFEIKNNLLIENSSLNSQRFFEKEDSNVANTFKIEEIIKNFLKDFEIYKKFKKSKYVLRIISMTRDLNLSFWPGAEIALSKKNNSVEIEKINLVNKILKKISAEFGKNKKIFLVHIPYNIEVDLILWKKTFGKQPDKYNQRGAEKKIIEATKGSNIEFISTLEILQNESIKFEEGLYLKQDGHLNIIGNRIVAQIIYDKISNIYSSNN